MAKKIQTARRHRCKVAGQRVVNYYNHGTINLDARKNNSTTRKHEYSGCTFNGVKEYESSTGFNTPVKRSLSPQSKTTLHDTSISDYSNKAPTWLKIGAAVLAACIGYVVVKTLRKGECNDYLNFCNEELCERRLPNKSTI